MNALLIPTTIERYSPSKKQFDHVSGYIVVSPEGNELQPHMRKVSVRNELSASAFCEQQGWKYKIIKKDYADY